MGTATQTPVSSCVKKYFSSGAAAFDFEKQNREKNGTPQQYAYKCEDCSGYHLSTLKPGENELGKTTGGGSSLNRLVAIGGHRGERGETTEKVRVLLGQGKSPKEIAALLDIAINNVYYHINKVEGKTPNKNSGRRSSFVDLDTIQSEEQQLQAQLAALQAKKQQLIEAKRLKVEWYTNGGSIQPGKSIIVRKEGESFVCTTETAKELISKLEELLTAVN